MTLVLVKDRRAWLITAAENTDVRTPPPSPAKWAGTAHLDFPPAQKNSSASSAHSTSDRRGPRREAEAASSQRSLESCVADLAWSARGREARNVLEWLPAPTKKQRAARILHPSS